MLSKLTIYESHYRIFYLGACIAIISFMIKVALHRKQQVNNTIHGLFIDIDRQLAMPNSRNTNFAARALTILTTSCFR